MNKLLVITLWLTFSVASYATDVVETRLYMLDCGRIVVREEDKSSIELPNACYVIKHGNEWMMWDTGLPDSWADLPVGMTHKWSGKGRYELFVDRSVESQLAEIGINYQDIGRVGFSHLHFDHTGNANKFGHALWLLQKAELDSAENAGDEGLYRKVRYKDLQSSEHLLLEGDFDVFGDGSVMILSTAGHSDGFQTLLVNLPQTGTVMLVATLAQDEKNQEMLDEIRAIAVENEAQIWFAHEPTQFGFIDKSPLFHR